jgi:predicted Zn-dependent protease
LKSLSLTLCLVLACALLGAPARTAAAAVSPAAALGETFKHAEGGIQFELPDGWKAEAEGEQLTVGPEDDTISMVFWVPEGDTFEAAVDALGDELSKTVKNPKLDGEPKTDKHNGMDHVGVTGSGAVEGVQVLFSVDVLMAKKPVIVLSFAAPGMFEKHAAAMQSLIKSIKKMA